MTIAESMAGEGSSPIAMSLPVTDYDLFVVGLEKEVFVDSYGKCSSVAEDNESNTETVEPTSKSVGVEAAKVPDGESVACVPVVDLVGRDVTPTDSTTLVTDGHVVVRVTCVSG